MSTEPNPQRRWKCLFATIALALLPISGCKTKALLDPIPGPDHQVQNVFRKEAHLPIEVRRVAILPLSLRESTADLTAGKQNLEPVLQAELTKAGRFETIFVKPTELRQWTGSESFDAYESLPPRLLKILEEKTGAQGVLFPHLAEYKAYPPILIGWRMKLVGTDGDIIWSAEEMFDASEPAVSNSARRYERDHARNNPVLEDNRSILLRPTRFGQFTLKAVFETLPLR